jgi:hypothetical protein
MMFVSEEVYHKELFITKFEEGTTAVLNFILANVL